MDWNTRKTTVEEGGFKLYDILLNESKLMSIQVASSELWSFMFPNSSSDERSEHS